MQRRKASRAYRRFRLAAWQRAFIRANRIKTQSKEVGQLMAEVKEKIRLDKSLIDKARNSAKRVAENTQSFIDLHTTIAVERAVCRLLGIDGVNEFEVPLPNVVCDALYGHDLLSNGAAYVIGCLIKKQAIPQKIAEA